MGRSSLRDIQKNTAIATIKLGAQDTAIAFYQKLGFTVISEGYLDAAIPHHAMAMKLG